MSPEAQGARGSQGANQVFLRFNSFVLCLIGCWARLGFLWPQLETSVKRLDGHSESVNCFQQSASLTVPLFLKSRPVPCLAIYLVHEVFTESCISRPLVCIMPVFVTTGATAALLRLLLMDINSPVFTQDRIEPGPLFLRHHEPGLPWTVVTRICISSASVWPSTGLHKSVFLGLFFVLRINVYESQLISRRIGLDLP